MIEAFLLHTDILLIDPEGDAHYRCPHLYAEFSGPSGPYSGFNPRLSVRGEEIDLDDSWRRIGFFPKTLSGAEREFRVQQTQRINLDPETLKRFQEHKEPLDTLYAVDSRFDFLRPGDIIAVADTARTPDEPDRLLQILHIETSSLPDYLNDNQGNYRIREMAKRQIGRDRLFHVLHAR